MRGSLSAILSAMTLLPTGALSQSGNFRSPAILPLKARVRQPESYQRRKRQTPNISEPLSNWHSGTDLQASLGYLRGTFEANQWYKVVRRTKCWDAAANSVIESFTIANAVHVC